MTDSLYWHIAGQILRKHGIENTRLQSEIANEFINTDLKAYRQGAEEVSEIWKKEVVSADPFTMYESTTPSWMEGHVGD